MTLERAKELMEIELACVQRGSGKKFTKESPYYCWTDGKPCDRQCGNCDLVQDDAELQMAYRVAINILKAAEIIFSGVNQIDEIMNETEV